MEATEIIKELHFYQGLSDYFAENNVKEDRYKKAVKAKIAEFGSPEIVRGKHYPNINETR